MSKIYDFLPGHLKSSELETIFETTLERVFSKGDMEKVRAYVGRKEKGINSEKDIYLNFPPHAFTRENYGLEPTYSSDDQKVFYEDLLNSLFNKGALTNDHRRLFETDKKTINLPIDLDKFVNWSMYYWVSPGFVTDNSLVQNANKHYITVGRGGTDWWSTKNSWYHYDDIRDKITDDNFKLIAQAKRPIIEFDKRLELSDASQALAANADWTYPLFKIYINENPDEAYLKDAKIFCYTLGDSTLYESDIELGFTPLVKSGDYVSEYCFETDIPDNAKMKLVVPNVSIEFREIYIKTEFDYRNFRQEFGRDATNVLTLSQTPKNENAIDVYIDGIKQINNYSVNGSVITFNVSSNPEGFVYVDYCTNGPVVSDGDKGFQRIHHSLEYNPENKTYNQVQIPYSTWYEHFVRIIETTPGLSGEPNGVNNYRQRGDNTDKFRHNNQGSVLVTNSIDVSDGYFSLSRNDYDPIDAFEFLSTAYQGYKNKFVTTVIEILQTSGSQSKTDLQILEEAIDTIGLSKRQSISIFDNLFKINYGEIFSHYQEEQLTINAGEAEPFFPSNISSVVNDNELTVIQNGKVLKLDIDYTIGTGGNSIKWTVLPDVNDVVILRKYDSVKEAYIPPSSTFLNINPAFIPGIVVDRMYTTNPPSATTDFIQGHDGSITPMFGDRTDDILIMFETLIWNSLPNAITDTNVDRYNYGPYQQANTEWELYEKNYTMYPFFKKWMIRNNIDNLQNTAYDPNDWTTWNYRTINADSPGHWRGIYEYAYNTDRPLEEPWKTVGFSQEPNDFKNKHGFHFNTITFWNNLFAYYNITGIPVPVDANGDLKEPNVLFFNNSITTAEIALMKEDFEFGDGSPAEMAWRRSSEYPFIEFILMMLTKPFKVFFEYNEQVAQGITIYNSREGFNTQDILAEKNLYEFKLGSKLGGFVNNFRLLAENTSLNNSRFTDIPKDNFDLVIHSGEPNRSEFFSAILVEKVSLDSSYPTYSLGETPNYVAGDIVLNTSDEKFYRRKATGQSTAEASGNITFDYSSWVMISQPKTRKYGYRIQGYDDFNPTFFAMEWDKSSGEKAFSTKGDRENLNEWQQGSFYRQNAYMKYQGQPYICLREHTSSTLLDENIEDWKQLVEWPRTNIVTTHGYNKFSNDQIKSYNYGQILESLDDVTHLMLGYQKYLEFIGWGFTDVDEVGQTIDFEQLLYKFLEWESEDHGPSEFITLSPMLLTGSFTAPYGVASVRKETHKNFYRVVDASGRLISSKEINFTTDGKTINFRSSVPIFGIKIDVQDVEHAFVVDQVDSFGDVIYDPFLHNRNLRMQIDCNRSANWDGTLTIDGFLPFGDELLPNFETLTSDSKFYRDTLVDQNLEITNRLKESQIGYSKRDYLRNHGIERESQLEFYKGFLSHKGTNSAVNRIVNNNGNFKDIKHHNIWAFKRAEYGKLNTGFKAIQSVNTVDMISDPHVVQFDGIVNSLVYRKTPKAFPIKTTGYVDGRDVTYTVNTENSLQNLSGILTEGETAWVQFDPVREWDVRRLSEIAEIGYIGETADNQLYVGLTNSIDTIDSVYLKIKNTDIEPEIADYYYLVDNGTREVDGTTIFEYLVFELNYEPLIVEIDSSTTDSLFVPTGSESRIEAIGTVSFPAFASGDALVIDGEQFTYTPGTGGGSTGIVLGGSTATVDPVVDEGEQARIVVYDTNGSPVNSNTLITFDGTSARGSNGVTANDGDKFTINGDEITVAFASTQSIEAISQITTSDNLTTGGTLVFDSTGEVQETVTAQNIQFVGNIADPTLSATKSLSVNGTLITFNVGASPMTTTEIINTINSSSASITASQDASNFLVIDSSDSQVTLSGSILVDLGLLASGSSLSESKLNLLAIDINAISYLTAFINANNQLEIETANDDLQISGTLRSPMGFLGTYDATDDPTAISIVNQINANNISGISATRVGSNIKITSSTNQLDIEEVTTGAMSRLGFATNPVEVDSVTTIKDNINEALLNLPNTNATIVNRQIVITSDQSSIVLENVSGNPWNDIGIAVGTYNSSGGGTVSSATEFKDQINAATSNVLVSITSDGRMVFSNNNVSLSFNGTSQDILDRIGIFEVYSAVTSNPNFKAMRWKSVRYTPFFLFDTFDSFYNDLGLNAQALVWADDYSNNGWAVLNRDATGTLSIKGRQADVIEPDFMKRVILQDGESYNLYQLFDPLNLKFPGEIMKNLDYVSWEDPASYDKATSKDLWLDQYLGETWWDTSLARYYRYNDYGDENGTLIESFASRYWGKLVPGSEINVKKWTKSEKLPENITTFNSKVRFDTDKNKSITEYFYWSEEGADPTHGKTTSIEEIKMLLESGNIRNKFIPISADKILISNNSYIFENPVVSVCLEYNTSDDIDKSHADWELIQEYTERKPHQFLIVKLIESLSNIKYKHYNQQSINQAMLGDPDNTRVNVSFIDASGGASDASIDDTVVTINNNIVDAQYLTFFTDGNPNNAQVWISKEYQVIVGDIIRVYRMEPCEDNWFTDLQSARENFASSINSYFSSRHLVTTYPNYQDYIQADNLALSLGDWYLTDEYKKIERFQYLSKTRNFDMLKLYNTDGVTSFKLELPTGNEYYFEHEGSLRLVNHKNRALKVSFNDIVFPENGEATKKYYENAMGVQIQELFGLLLNQNKSEANDRLLNRIFFDMINYLFTEKSYPDFIFKTSYIDLNMFNRNLRKYAIYQRDSYDDVIEYINEAKPYHTKIREVWRYYGKEEEVNADVDIDENMNITLDFGNNKRYSDNILDGGNPELDDPTEYPEDGTYEAGRLLRTRYTQSDGTGADEFDTGLIKAGFRDSSIVFVDQFTDANKTVHEKTFIYIYDMFGRGYKVDVKGESTVSSFDGDTLIVDTSSIFDEVGESDKKLIALRNETTGDIEFMAYDKKNTVNLSIADRGLYTGYSTGLGTTNKAYSLGTPLEIVLHEMV
tara:strand:+ start:16921 stop:25755 length:8835 start_codon:yes stop_codon:yes gene_type:complete